MLPRFSLAQAPAPAPASSGADPLSYVNSEFRDAVKKWHLQPGSNQPWNEAMLKQARSQHMELAPLAASPAVREVMIPGPAGAPQVKVYVTGDVAGAAKPALLHIHGGGYILGSAHESRGIIQEIAATHNCVAVTVEYRLAPETAFPGSLEDNYAALRWMHANAKELGIDTSRIAVGGESAGGGHAAALAIAVRDRAEFSLCLQALIYPMLDDRTGSTRKLAPFMGQYIWTPEDNRYGWTSLLGVPAGSASVPANSVPARVENLAGLAPAWIGVGSIDLFAPEDLEYAQRLMAAGVPVEVNLVPGGFHGFNFIAADASLSQQFKKSWNEAIRRAFAKT
jgi:acetyl esterase/lipase